MATSVTVVTAADQVSKREYTLASRGSFQGLGTIKKSDGTQQTLIYDPVGDIIYAAPVA